MKIIIKLVIFILLLNILSFSCSYLPEQEEYSEYNNIIEETGDYILLSREKTNYSKAFVFIPGGLVDPHVYLCWMNELVENLPDLTIISIKTPSNLAILKQGKTLDIIDDFPTIESWIIGGHSLGGVVAASNIKENPDLFDGLIFLASWTNDFADLREWTGSVLSIYGTEDGVADISELELNKEFLPPGEILENNLEFLESQAQTIYYPIEGGNHSGFGCYGLQKGDNIVELSTEDQQKIMMDGIISFLSKIWI
jgi:pimeloyl-ACP methyl ester carboxylesterase